MAIIPFITETSRGPTPTKTNYKKYRNLSWQKIAKRFFKHHNPGRRKRWADGLAVFLIAEISVYRFSLKWMRYPNFAIATGEQSA